MAQKWNSNHYSNDAAFVSELGLPVVDLLAPQPQENILDLGCGDGTLAAKIASLGCNVTGVDFSESMVNATTQKGIPALQMSGEALQFNQDFDAVFSNAAVHWMKDYQAVIRGVNQALKPQGRFVGEFGGYGNIRTISEAIRQVYEDDLKLGEYHSPWYFPSDTEYKQHLEQHGFDVSYIELIDRPTPLKSGIEEWLIIFAEHATSKMDSNTKHTFLKRVTELVKPKLYSEQEGWVADYVRLRFAANKIEDVRG